MTEFWETTLAQATADFRDPFTTLPAATAAVRLGAALLFGAIIGLDREWRSKPAGLRTHMLVSSASCTFALLALSVMESIDQDTPSAQFDPLRLIEAVTAGVAFLAAGTILQARGKVMGLTTGAGLWMAGAIGLACGLGRLPLAAMATGTAFVVITVAGALERLLGIKDPDDQD